MEVYFFIDGIYQNENNDYQGYIIEIEIPLNYLVPKNISLNLEIGKEKKYQNLSIKALKCKNSEFDDDPEITAYLQVKDLKIKTMTQFLFLMDGHLLQVQL